MVAEAAAGPSQEEEARQASVQELQSLRDSLNQAEAKTKELEGQLDNINKVKPNAQVFHKFHHEHTRLFYIHIIICIFLAFHRWSQSVRLKRVTPRSSPPGCRQS